MKKLPLKLLRRPMKYLNKLSLVFLVVVAVLGAYTFGSCGRHDDTQYQKELSAWKDKAATAIAVSDSINRENNRIRLENIKRDSITNAQGQEIARLRKNADVMRQKNDATLDSLQKTLPDTCKSALDLAKNYRKEGDSLRIALDTAHVRDSVKTSQIADLTKVNEKFRVSNDSLKKLIITVPEYKEKKILGFIPLPNRKVTFIAGVILGGTLAVYGDDIAKGIARH